MNHYNLQLIANEQLAGRYAEAERSRLARSGYPEAQGPRKSARTRQAQRRGGVLGTLFHRVALL